MPVSRTSVPAVLIAGFRVFHGRARRARDAHAPVFLHVLRGRRLGHLPPSAVEPAGWVVAL